MMGRSGLDTETGGVSSLGELFHLKKYFFVLKLTQKDSCLPERKGINQLKKLL